jgi:hypothetical protein
LLGSIAGGGTYEEMRPQAELVLLHDILCPCLSLDKLIAAKRAAGRPKDFEAIGELELILDRQPG